MCAGAMVQARIPRLVYAVPDVRAGAAGSVFEVVRSPALNHRVEVSEGVLAIEARDQLNRFFRGLRRRNSGTLSSPGAVSELDVVSDEEGCPSG